MCYISFIHSSAVKSGLAWMVTTAIFYIWVLLAFSYNIPQQTRQEFLSKLLVLAQWKQTPYGDSSMQIIFYELNWCWLEQCHRLLSGLQVFLEAKTRMTRSGVASAWQTDTNTAEEVCELLPSSLQSIGFLYRKLKEQIFSHSLKIYRHTIKASTITLKHEVVNTSKQVCSQEPLFILACLWSACQRFDLLSLENNLCLWIVNF